MLMPLLIGGVCIITSIIGTFFVKLGKSGNIMGALYKGFAVTAILSIPAIYWAIDQTIGLTNTITAGDVTFTGMNAFWCGIVGLVVTALIIVITEYYTSTEYRPVRSIAKASETAPIKTSDEFKDVKISPVAKKLMEENQLSIDDVIAGLHRLSKKDIEQVVENKGQAPVAMAQPEPVERNIDRKKMSNLRKKLSARLVSVKNETAMLTTFNEVDMSAVMQLRKKYQKQFVETHDIKLGFMSFFTKAVSIALKAHPTVNSMMDGDEIVTPNYMDVAMAVQTPKGLMVPVIRDTQNLGLADIERELMRLANKARTGKISLDEMTGGTFTITNGGVFGSLLSTPIINPPQSGILGMHNIVERPIAVNGKVEIRPMMYIALSYDHRVIDGKDSVGFLVKIKELIENPHRMITMGQDPDSLLLGI